MRMTYGLALAVAVLSCTAGELSEDEAQDFRAQLKKYYPPESETDEETDGEETESSEPDESEMETEAPAPSPSATPTMEPPAMPDAGSGDDTTQPAVTDFAPCVMEVFTTTCAGADCHFGGPSPQSPDFGQENLFEVLTTETPVLCVTENTYVDLDTPNESFILQKIRGQQPLPCGSRMPPLGQDPLTNEQLDCLENWFESLEP